MFKITSAAICH